MTIVVMRMRTWRDVHVVHLIFPKWISEFSLTSHSTCAEWIIFMYVFCFSKLTQYQISMTEKNNNFIWWSYLKLIDNIYILSFIIFICLEWFQLITQSIKYLTVNHVLMILMCIHNSCNNALLFSLIERTQNVKTNINDNSRSYPMIILAKQLQNIWDCVISSLESTFQNSVRPRNSSLFRVIIYFRGLKTR